MENKPDKQKRWVLIVTILMFVVGIVGLGEYLSEVVALPEWILASMALLLSGVGAHELFKRTARRWLLHVATLFWVMALVQMGVFFEEQLLMHEGLIMAIICPSIGLLIYMLYRKDDADARLHQAEQEWRKLGDYPRPEERDRPIEDPMRESYAS